MTKASELIQTLGISRNHGGNLTDTMLRPRLAGQSQRFAEDSANGTRSNIQPGGLTS